MIIDIHAHTSDRRLNGLYTDNAKIHYLRWQAEILGISKICLMATYFPLKLSGLPNKAILERIKGDDLFLCFGSLDMENNWLGGLNELIELAESKQIAGIKLYPGYQNIVLSDPTYAPLFALAAKYGLPVACHLGELHHCCPSAERNQLNFRCGQKTCLLDDEKRRYLAHPDQLALVAQNFPEVNFIACHLANPYFSDLRRAMAVLPNIYSDISGQFLSGTAEDSPAYRRELIGEIKLFLDLPSGADRIMFGSDFPIQSQEDSLSIIEALDLSPADKEKILHRNAEKILNLKLSLKPKL